MKFEQFFKFFYKIKIYFDEITNIFQYAYGSLKLKYFVSWKTSAFADYFWFIFSNKTFTFFDKTKSR
jgi:hypothetical protein